MRSPPVVHLLRPCERGKRASSGGTRSGLRHVWVACDHHLHAFPREDAERSLRRHTEAKGVRRSSTFSPSQGLASRVRSPEENRWSYTSGRRESPRTPGSVQQPTRESSYRALASDARDPTVVNFQRRRDHMILNPTRAHIVHPHIHTHTHWCHPVRSPSLRSRVVFNEPELSQSVTEEQCHTDHPAAVGARAVGSSELNHLKVAAPLSSVFRMDFRNGQRRTYESSALCILFMRSNAFAGARTRERAPKFVPQGAG